MDSILNTIKKMLGVPDDYYAFDTDIIIGINSAIMALTQIGVGPADGFVVSDEAQTWSDFIGERKDLEAIKQYIYCKTRLAFDPPTSSFVIEAIKDIIREDEFRLSVAVDPKDMGESDE